jgi:hypothetical protein
MNVKVGRLIQWTRRLLSTICRGGPDGGVTLVAGVDMQIIFSTICSEAKDVGTNFPISAKRDVILFFAVHIVHSLFGLLVL